MANTDIYDVDEKAPKPKDNVEPLYRIYKGSKLAVGRGVGKSWEQKKEAALKAHESTMLIWDEVLRYYNNDQSKGQQEPRGQIFTRGDGSENIVFSNLNVMLPAVYSKNPDITVNTIDKDDEPFCQSIQTLLNALIKRKDRLNAKQKVKRSTALGLLTNFGVLKFDYVQKDDSRELAVEQYTQLTEELKTVEDSEKAEEIYGKMQALELSMEVFESSGPKMYSINGHKNLIVDPYAEQPDGLDGDYMIERIKLKTAMLNARFTECEYGKDGEQVGEHKYVYKPTHKAVFSEGDGGNKDDGVGYVFKHISGAEADDVSKEEREAYINLYYTDCALVWDKITRRVLLFAWDDWKWPIWVWDDPLKLSRFFPYFIIGFGTAINGTVNVGEVAYYLDQQDEINEINKQVRRIRRAIFNFFFYNSDATNRDEIEKFISALKGDTVPNVEVVGIKAGDQPLNNFIGTLEPPSVKHEAFFNKQPAFDTINRITNTSDALRGVQFKTNTTEDAVQTYQESMRLSVGAKVDVIEDVLEDFAIALAETCIQFMTQEEVAGIIGEKKAADYRQMSVAEFHNTISTEVVAGSMEKPNSIFKKKEAIQAAQAVGQFAKAAPGGVLKIMLKVLQQAFTEVVIKKEDWDTIDKEIEASLMKGNSQAGAGGGAASGGEDLKAMAQKFPPEVKQKIMAMGKAGVPPQQIAALIKEQAAQMNGATNG